MTELKVSEKVTDVQRNTERPSEKPEELLLKTTLNNSKQNIKKSGLIRVKNINLNQQIIITQCEINLQNRWIVIAYKN